MCLHFMYTHIRFFRFSNIKCSVSQFVSKTCPFPNPPKDTFFASLSSQCVCLLWTHVRRQHICNGFLILRSSAETKKNQRIYVWILTQLDRPKKVSGRSMNFLIVFSLFPTEHNIADLVLQKNNILLTYHFLHKKCSLSWNRPSGPFSRC